VKALHITVKLKQMIIAKVLIDNGSILNSDDHARQIGH
jgi:hypothetical protein